MTEVFDPNNVPMVAGSSLDLTRRLLAVKDEMFAVPLADGTVLMPAKWLMVNIFLWRPLVRRGIPVEKRHTLNGGLITANRLADWMTVVYVHVVIERMSMTGTTDQREVQLILEDLCETVNDLHTMIATQLGAYHISISAFELSDLMLSPEIVKLTEVDVSRELTIGITATEDKLKAAGKVLMDRLHDPELPSNVLAPFLQLGHLSPQQLPNLLLAFGHRKDASDTVVRYPVLSSGIKGLNNIIEYAVMSLDAKLTVYYNSDAMPRSQYNNRKQQILSSAIYRLYPGDCGSTVTVPFLITADNVKNVVDKNIVIQGKQGTLRLTKEVVGDYVGKVVHFRSPLTCRHTNGTCHVCGGYLTEFMPPQSIVGIACTVEYMSKVAQLVLSAKHFTTTRAITYTIPEQLRDILVVKNNDIYLRENVMTDKLKIGVQFRDIPLIRHLQPSDDDTEMAAFSEQQFSTIHIVQFADVDTGLSHTPEIGMGVETTIPYFSTEFLSHIKDRFSAVTVTDDWVWIPLKKFDHVNAPLFRCVVQSSSMIKFNTKLARFATSEIGKYTSIPQALERFAQEVYQEVNPNIFHLECVLKSYLITSETDYNVPLVTDVNNVKFGTLLGIIPRRSLGGMFAYEQLARHMADPATYIFPHRDGFFDPHFYSDA